MKKTLPLSLIAALGENRVIGVDNSMPWHLPGDFKYFKATTLGKPIIMGRKTWDSLPDRFRPLPGRVNIVVTRNPQWQAAGAKVASSVDDALAQASDAPKVFVIGGATLYAAALPLADELVLTEIDRDFTGDVSFPAWKREQFREIQRESHHAGEPNDFDYAFVTYQRKD